MGRQCDLPLRLQRRELHGSVRSGEQAMRRERKPNAADVRCKRFLAGQHSVQLRERDAFLLERGLFDRVQRGLRQLRYEPRKRMRSELQHGLGALRLVYEGLCSVRDVQRRRV
jgi:hypothetical protein